MYNAIVFCQPRVEWEHIQATTFASLVSDPAALAALYEMMEG